MLGRNHEFEETLDEQSNHKLDAFVTELLGEIDDIEDTLAPDNDSHRILLNWIRDKIVKLRDDFQENK